ncbi:hypothetical protein D4A35_18150 (plasmid) [Paraclostridium bifermentans]|uniref:Transposase InsH N-terminal domain-containing protein n=1 Tax=Paraclostridium bifermentans TaxID=1490 RepID=A0A5P3XKF6_PARBF|nr:hypothetical protein D4A35_18150 [Paraclostridium bifermentans]
MFKILYVIGMALEESVIEPSSLTKFRKLRLKDMNLLDILINKTVEIAIKNRIIKSKSIIVYATHTKSKYNQKSPKEILMYEIDYCQKLIRVVENKETIIKFPKLKEKLNILKNSRI